MTNLSNTENLLLYLALSLALSIFMQIKLWNL